MVFGKSLTTRGFKVRKRKRKSETGAGARAEPGCPPFLIPDESLDLEKAAPSTSLVSASAVLSGSAETD